ncbi:hypothetical protein D1841_15045 [Neglecta sp. X4]|nr:hypothetical protein [Neglectibacter sp. 59]NBJ74529.1 hypothetical protein [Neglectibacter sp. X4]NCE82362.1 hypothetical protein [Neglectibacter sp. X58]
MERWKKRRILSAFTDGQGEFCDLEISETFYIKFRQMERCRPQSIMHSVIRAREKIKAVKEKYRAGQ